MASNHPISQWTSGKITSTVIAGLVPLLISASFVWFRLPRCWLRDGGVRPNFISWFLLFLTCLIWMFLGMAVPIGLYGVSEPWWILPMINLVYSLLPFIFISLQTSIKASLVALLLGIGVVAQFSVFQNSWLAAVCSTPYVLWTLGTLIIMWNSRACMLTKKDRVSCRLS